MKFHFNAGFRGWTIGCGNRRGGWIKNSYWLLASGQKPAANSQQLDSNIRIAQHRVIEAVREIGHACGER